ncbi:MAG: hypothetical protein R3325_13935, partial [Thermoanaerobaculia bacterium]|nr:hypothetical protein [Thermoanaerobaculia bacterium]
MRKTSLLCLIVGAAALPAVPAGPPSPTVDEIVSCHVAARGGLEAIRAIDTLVYRDGLYEEGEYVGSGDAFMAFARPFYRVVGDPDGPGG